MNGMVAKISANRSQVELHTADEVELIDDNVLTESIKRERL